MPDLKELLKERNVKKFTKKTYRPWDLSGSGACLSEEHSFEQAIPSVKTTPLGKEEISDVETISISKYMQENSNLVLGSIKDNHKISNIYHTDTRLGNNQESIVYPIDNSIGNNENTEGYQLDNLQDNIQISNHKSLPKKISLNERIEKPENSEISTQIDTSDIDVFSSDLEQEIIRLSGKQKIIFDLVIEICSTRNSLETGPVQTASLAMVAQTTIGTTKTTIKRLIDKNLIIRYPGKNAKGGYINLGITNQILMLVENIKNNNKSNLFASDIILAHRYQKDISQEIYSSSNIINTITTNNINKKIESMPTEWENINFDPLTHIGFSKTQIKQMIGKNEPAVVQESIYHFAFGLEHNQKFKKYEEPLNVLMGVLRKGQGWVEADFRSASEIAQEKFLESKKAENARKKALEEEAFKLALSEWEEEISQEEHKKLTEKKNGDLTPPTAMLSKYFRDNIWPTKRGEYFLT